MMLDGSAPILREAREALARAEREEQAYRKLREEAEHAAEEERLRAEHHRAAIDKNWLARLG
jgi:hypothetical protein